MFVAAAVCASVLAVATTLATSEYLPQAMCALQQALAVMLVAVHLSHPG
jgi:hypothetical protein